MRHIISILGICSLLLIGLAACGGPAGIPRAKEGTLLRKIQDRGKIIVGVRYELPTFGYLNPQTNKVEGFEPALARELAAHIFGDPNKVEFKEAITQNRIPYLKDGTVDVVMSNFVYSEERLKEVDGSIVYFTTGATTMIRPDSPIRSVADLDAKKKVAMAKGSVYIEPFKKLSPAEIVLFDTYAQAAQALTDKQVDAIVNSDVILYSIKISFPSLQIVGARLSTEYVGAAVAKGNPELLEVVNTFVRNAKTSGKWKQIWKTEIGDKLGITTVAEPPGDEWKK